jgi:hypothetical protein
MTTSMSTSTQLVRIAYRRVYNLPFVEVANRV